MRLSHSKLSLSLGGATVLERTVGCLASSRCFDDIHVCVAPRDEEDFRLQLKAYSEVRFVHGGDTRRESVWKALESIAARGAPTPRFVLVHDGARCFLEHDLIERVLESARVHGAATAAVPLTDTLKRARADLTIGATVEREGLWRIQTPQAFRFELLLEAHREFARQRMRENELAEVTDDCTLVEMSTGVKLVPGSAANLKITTPDDLPLARMLAAPEPPETGPEVHCRESDARLRRAH